MDIYEILIDGHLGLLWQSWFPNMAITNQENGTTKIFGPVRDQAELHAYILSIQDLGMTLLSVEKKGIEDDLLSEKSISLD